MIPDTRVRNVVMFIGDGMGISHIAAARTKLLGPGGRLHMERMPVAGFVCTHTLDNLVTKSDAAATALATGFKTRNGMVGMAPDSTAVLTIVEAARDRGLATGIITTSTITDATPASFATHVPARKNLQQIARQLVDSRVNILLGGGRGNFIPNSLEGGTRSDGQNLIDTARSRGYEYVQQPDGLDGIKGEFVLGLFGLGALYDQETSPSLRELTQKAIETLSRNRAGFFLVVEQEGIDEGSHRNDFDFMTRALASFDEAVGLAIQYALRDSTTLVIVTADHETGGLQIDRGDHRSDEMRVAWGSTGHTGQPVPILSLGPHASRFTGIKDNSEIPRILAQLLDLPGLPRPTR
jgi:alkaline phosphatase